MTVTTQLGVVAFTLRRRHAAFDTQTEPCVIWKDLFLMGATGRKVIRALSAVSF